MPTKAEMPAQDNKPVALAIPQWRADQHMPRRFERLTNVVERHLAESTGCERPAVTDHNR